MAENVDKENIVKKYDKLPQAGVKKDFLVNRRKVQALRRLSQEKNKDEKIKEDKNMFVHLTAKQSFQKPKIYFANSLLYNEIYRQDIWIYLLENEKTYFKPNSTYMLKQRNITWNDRSIVINWLIEVAEKFNYNAQTIHLTANYIDRYLSKVAVKSSKFQLVGVAAMALATKIEEYSCLPLEKWSYLTAKSYTPNEIYKMEIKMFKILEFNMYPTTIYEFIQYLFAEYKMNSIILHMAMFIAELTILEGVFHQNYFHSQLAASTVILARFLLLKPNYWPVQLKKLSGYCLKDLFSIIEALHNILKSYSKTRWEAIYRKYSDDKYCKVARINVQDFELSELIEE